MFINRCYDMNDKMPMEGKMDGMTNMAGATQMNPCCAPMMPQMCPPIYECPQERCCHREICHEVEHIVPINTRVINHHIYKHVYRPCYTCCEENEVSNVYENPCCF